MVKGSKNPIELYTVIVQFESIVETNYRFLGMEKKEKMRQMNMEKRAVEQRVFEGKIASYQIYLKDEDIKELRKNVDKDFEVMFN